MMELSLVLAVEVLRLVAHPVASVPNHGHNNLIFCWQAVFFKLSSRAHGDLITGAKCAELACLTDILILQAGAHGVHVKERVLPVLDIGDRGPVHRLMSGVTDSSQVHVSALLLSLDSLELCVVEVGCVVQVLLLGGAVVISFQAAEVVCVELFHVGGGETLDGGGSDALAVLAVDGGTGGLGE